MTKQSIVIYTRFSSEMQRSDSCDDQIRKVQEGLRGMGIDPQQATILRDEAISGTREDRPGYQQILDYVKSGVPVLLAVDDQSRLSRGDTVKSLIRNIVFCGGRFVSVGEGIDTEKNGWEIQVGLHEIHNALTISDLGRRVRRGQEGRILDGNGSAGDYPFGYRSVFVNPHAADNTGRGQKPKRKVVIDEEEAQVVRQVFELCAEGFSLQEIARRLTRGGVKKGRKCQETDTVWRAHRIKKILTNEKYIGTWTWGSTRTIRNGNGRKKQIAVDSTEIVQVQRPELRIVAQVLWDRVQERLAEMHRIYGKKPGHKKSGAKTHHKSAEYPMGLLNGLLVCHCCGATLINQGSNIGAYFGCPKYRSGACTQKGRVRKRAGEDALLSYLRSTLLADSAWLEETYQVMTTQARELLAGIPQEEEQTKRTLQQIEKEIGNLCAFAASGNAPQSLLEQLHQREERKAELLLNLAQMENKRKTLTDLPDKAWMMNELTELKSLLEEGGTPVWRRVQALLGPVTAVEILPPGKTKGYMRLRFSPRPLAVLGGRSLELCDIDNASTPEVAIDLGGPTAMDALMPKVHALRQEGLSWRKIGMKLNQRDGNLHTAYQRYKESLKSA